MTEELIREARAFAALGSDLNPVEANRLIFELTDELEAATEPDWQYRISGAVVYTGADQEQVADALARGRRVSRRVAAREAGPWLPVEGENNA